MLQSSRLCDSVLLKVLAHNILSILRRYEECNTSQEPIYKLAGRRYEIPLQQHRASLIYFCPLWHIHQAEAMFQTADDYLRLPREWPRSKIPILRILRRQRQPDIPYLRMLLFPEGVPVRLIDEISTVRRP